MVHLLIYNRNQDKEITLILVPFYFANGRGDENMCDWNNNGRYDMQDAFINYHIHRSISGNKSSASNSEIDGDAILTVIAVGLLILGILIIFA